MSIFQPKKKTVEQDAVPTNVEQAIPIQGVYEDGIFLVGRNLWSKTFITQNCEDLLQSHTARTMLANSELVIMLNQAATDREQLAELMGISDLQMSYITNVEAGHGLVKIGGALVPFVNNFPKDTRLYKLCTTKPGE